MQKHMPQLLSAMTPFPYHINADQSVEKALQLMLEHNIRHLPVMIDDNIESIVSDRDIKRAQLIGHRGTSDEELLVGDICPPCAYFADVYDPLDQVLEVLIERRLEAVIVLKEGAPVGIFTDTDACCALLALLQEVYQQPDGDNDDAA
jgi:acetoin utilization protein AcuB